MIWLVASRELRERLRTRSLRISTAIIVVLVAAVIVVPELASGRTSTYDVAIVGQVSAPVREGIIRAGRLVGATVRLRDVDSATLAEAQVRSRAVDVALTDARTIVVRDPIEGADRSRKARFVGTVSEIVRVQVGLELLGVAPEIAAAALRAPPPQVRSLEPAKADATRRATALAGAVVLYVLMVQYGAWILNGVVEEKASRVVEVLLSTLHPRQLLFGKVLGIGAIALGQGAIIVGTALVAAAAVGSDLLDAAPLGALGVTTLWFLLGYALYCSLYAAVGSLCSRPEDAQNAAFPVQIPLLVGYFVGFTTLGGGDPSLVVRLLAYFPPTAPLVMPVLVGSGGATPWQVALSVALTLVTIALVVRVSGDIYSRSVLRTGSRIRLRDALRERRLSPRPQPR